MPLFGQRILTDLTKLGTLKIAHLRLPRCDLNPVGNALTKDEREKAGAERTDVVKAVWFMVEMLGDHGTTRNRKSQESADPWPLKRKRGASGNTISDF